MIPYAIDEDGNPTDTPIDCDLADWDALHGGSPARKDTSAIPGAITTPAEARDWIAAHPRKAPPMLTYHQLRGIEIARMCAVSGYGPESAAYDLDTRPESTWRIIAADPSRPDHDLAVAWLSHDCLMCHGEGGWERAEFGISCGWWICPICAGTGQTTDPQCETCGQPIDDGECRWCAA